MSTEANAEWESTVSGLPFDDVEVRLQQAARAFVITLDYVFQTAKGSPIETKTVHFKVTGPASKVALFKGVLQTANSLFAS